MRKLSLIILCIWLIATGINTIFQLSLEGLEFILPALGMAAGILLLLTGKALKKFHPTAHLLIAIWFILSGAVVLFELSFNGLAFILGALSLVAGVFIIIGDRKKKIW